MKLASKMDFLGAEESKSDEKLEKEITSYNIKGYLERFVIFCFDSVFIEF